MSKTQIAYIIANFGGPRNLSEIEPFLTALLTDRDVIWTKLPNFLHNYLFKKVAKKRALKVRHDYDSIGGKSPIYEDTEAVASFVKKATKAPVLTFHRYLPETYESFVSDVKNLKVDQIKVFPMFPQFTYATTGSIARWFNGNLPQNIVNKMRWIKSYPGHPGFVQAYQTIITSFLKERQIDEKDTILLFSAHGVPESFVLRGDPYETECRLSFERIMQAFPNAIGRLAYQSKFGPEEWIKPYTEELCKQIAMWSGGRKNVVFIPLSFTSDHIETLYEVESQYMPIIKDAGLNTYRVPALTLHPSWLEAVTSILQESNLCTNSMLIRN